MRYVDEINLAHGGEGTKLYSTAGTRFKTVCIQNDLHLLDASVRHLGTDINYKVLQNIYEELKDKVTFFFDTPVTAVVAVDDGYRVSTAAGDYTCQKCVISVGRSGSKWMEAVCRELNIPTHSNRVDLGVRVELPAAVFAHLTDELYESKIVYRTEKHGDKVRTFCMKTPTASSPSMATATRTPLAKPKTPISPCWWRSTSRSLSRTPTAMARASRG